MNQLIESTLDSVKDSAYAVGEFAQGAVGLLYALCREFPSFMFALLVGLAVTGTVFYIDSGPAPTIQQQIAHYNRPGGTTHWLMQENGENPSGFLGLGLAGNKKQEADFDAAVKFCDANQGFTGCNKVIQAADAPDFGGM
jgi:hypothetical protein